MIEFMRNLILIIGWPVLVIGSILLFVRGRAVFEMMKGSLVGKIAKTLVITMLVGMYCLGIVATFYLFASDSAVYVVFPVFIAWFITFVMSLVILKKAKEETEKLAGK